MSLIRAAGSFFYNVPGKNLVISMSQYDYDTMHRRDTGILPHIVQNFFVSHYRGIVPDVISSRWKERLIHQLKAGRI